MSSCRPWGAAELWQAGEPPGGDQEPESFRGLPVRQSWNV